jgi:hypothetical protein
VAAGAGNFQLLLARVLRRGGDVRFNRQGHADDARLAGLRGHNFQLAVMCLDDFLADGEAKAEADVARGEKWRRRLLRGFRGESRAVVLNINLQILPAFVA